MGEVNDPDPPLAVLKLRSCLEPPPKKALTQAQIAEACDVTPQAVSQWVQGKVRPKSQVRKMLSALLGIPEEDWLTAAERERLQVVRDRGALVAEERSEPHAALPHAEPTS